MWPLRVQKASRIGDSLRASIPRVYHTTGKACRCRHIAAIEHLLLMSSEVSLDKKISVKEHELKCPKCEKKITSVTDCTMASTKTGRGTYVDDGFGTIWALNAVSVLHSGPDAVGHGNVGGQHPDALWGSRCM